MGDDNSQRDGEGAADAKAERKDPTSPFMKRFRSLPESSMRPPEKGVDDVVGKGVAKATPSQRPGAPPPNLDPTSGRPPPRKRDRDDDTDSELIGSKDAKPFVPSDKAADPKRETARAVGPEEIGGEGVEGARKKSSKAPPAERVSFPPDEPASTRIDLFLGIGAAVLVLVVVLGVWLGVQGGATGDDEQEGEGAITSERGVGSGEGAGEGAGEGEGDRDRLAEDGEGLAGEGEGLAGEGEGLAGEGEGLAGEGEGLAGEGEGLAGDGEGLGGEGEGLGGEGEGLAAGGGENAPRTGLTTPIDPSGLAELPEPPENVRLMNPWVRRNRAGTLRAEARRLNAIGRDEDAERMWLESLELYPESAEAQLSLARTIARLGRVEEGLAWARRAVATDPADPRAHEHVGDLLLQLERPDDALAAYRAGLAVAPSDIRLRSRIRRIDEH